MNNWRPEIKEQMLLLELQSDIIEMREFSKVEKKIVVNQQNSCKGFQCNRVDPFTNPLNSGVTL